MKKNEQRSIGIAGQVIEIEEISVGRVESFEAKIEWQPRAHEFAPERLKVWPGKPPGRRKWSLTQDIFDDMQSNLFNAKSWKYRFSV